MGAPARNLGITAVEAIPATFSTGVDRIRVQVSAFAAAVASAELSVIGPAGPVPVQEESAGADGTRWFAFVPDLTGRYVMRSQPAGAYEGDDRAVVDVERTRGLAVDWRIADLPMPNLEGWIDGGGAADVRIASLSALTAAQRAEPFLAIAGNYIPAAAARVAYFVEGTPLLEGINLDALERSGPVGLLTLPDGFSPVLRAADGSVWLAVRQSPRSAIVLPPQPFQQRRDIRNVSLLLFFNALRWITSGSDSVPLAHLETGAGVAIVSGFGEGDTSREALSNGTVAMLAPVTSAPGRAPFWPWIVLIAIALLALERAASIKWRAL